MLSAVNYHITQLNRFRCVLNQSKLKSTHLALYWENQFILAVDKCKYFGIKSIIVSETNCDGDYKRQKTICVHMKGCVLQ